ncbi:hypothetical protein [Methanococcoides burtonii]|uniref:hypothetical protein n=1 Tax=Methanococcoides burtonii TaxID=29291 RepID=UPI0012F68E8A|nr:hypothetical protein [Methanococcoides burtonii]
MDENEDTFNGDEIHLSDDVCANGSCCTSGCCFSFKVWVLIGIALGLLWYFAN